MRKKKIDHPTPPGMENIFLFISPPQNETKNAPFYNELNSDAPPEINTVILCFEE